VLLVCIFSVCKPYCELICLNRRDVAFEFIEAFFMKKQSLNEKYNMDIGLYRSLGEFYTCTLLENLKIFKVLRNLCPQNLL
jgi:hypothetical protein